MSLNFPFRWRSRQNRTGPAVSPACEALEPRQLLAATLVKDINPGSASSDPSPIVEAGNIYYFTANDGTHGRELWRTDGTPDGTVLVKDLLPGPASANPFALAELNDKLYFLTDGAAGAALWTSDGTAGGTTLLKSLPTTDGGSSPRQLTAAGNHLYFTRAMHALPDAELWKSDGTAAGTTLLRSFYNGQTQWPQYMSGVGNLTDVEGRLFFSATRIAPLDGTDIWLTDGSAVYDLDLNKGGTAQPRDLVAFDGALYLSASVDGTYHGVWRVDPETRQWSFIYSTGTHIDTFSVNATRLTVAGGRLYFIDTDGHELWVSDGTRAGTDRVPWPVGTGTQAVGAIAGAAGAVMFVGHEYHPYPNVTTGIWATDGTLGGTWLLKEADWRQFPQQQQMLAARQSLYFVYQNQLFEGSSIAKEPAQAIFNSSGPIASLSFEDGSLFWSGSSAGVGNELWWSRSLLQRSVTNVSASANRLEWEDEVSFTASVTSAGGGTGTPTGLVQFVDRGQGELGRVRLDASGVAALTVRLPQTRGPHDVRAVYLGDGAFESSESLALRLAVTGLTPIVRVEPSQTPVRYTDWVRVFVTVEKPAGAAAAVPTGRVILTGDAGNVQSEHDLDGRGQTTFLVQANRVGTIEVTVRYAGDDRYEPAVVPLSIEVPKDPTTMHFVTYDFNFQYGAPLMLSASVGASWGATGTIEIRNPDSGETFSEADVGQDGVLRWSPLLPVGTYRMQAVYSGDETNEPSSSPVITVTIVPTATRIKLGVAEGAKEGTRKLTTTVTPVPWPPHEFETPIHGIVAFMQGDRVIGSAAVIDGRATLSLAHLKPRRYDFRAVYKGDGGYAASAPSGPLSVDLRARTEVTPVVDEMIARQGETVTITARVAEHVNASGRPSGNVWFRSADGRIEA